MDTCSRDSCAIYVLSFTSFTSLPCYCKEFAFLGAIFPIKSRTPLERLSHEGKQTEKSQKLFPLVKIVEKMDGCMTCKFTSFSTVLQSYEDNEWMIMKGCVQWNPVYGLEDFTSSGIKPRSARSVG